MNMRESILIKVAEDLLDFRQLNGYELDYPNIIKGFIPISDCKNFPTVCYDLGGETSQGAGETTQQQLKSCRLIFSVYVSEFKEKGKIMNIREQAISDINKFIMIDTSVTHCLRLDEVVSEGINGNTSINDWDLQIEHSTDYTEGKAVIEATVNISYYDFHTQSNNYQNI